MTIIQQLRQLTAQCNEAEASLTWAMGENERLTGALATCRELREHDRAEVERLTGLLTEWENHAGPYKDAEIARLKESLNWWQSIEQVRLHTEIERLRRELAYCPRDMQVADGMIRDMRADNERLTAALQLSQSQNYCTLCGRALENKP